MPSRTIAHLVRAATVSVAMLALATPALPQDLKLDSDTFEGLRARALGPGVMSGRIACIDGVSGDRNQLWVGAAGGGVWVSKDAGTTWKPVFDKHQMSIGAIRISPKDPKTVWVGTGESWARNSVSVGDGVYKTTDGGDNWTRVGLEKTQTIARIRVDYEHPDTVYVAAVGPLFGPGEDRGVYRTRDGGKTWQKVLYVDETTGCADIAMDPQNPRILYAAMWPVRRRPWTFNSGGPGGGMYRSTDGGDTWKRLTTGLPAGDLGRIAIDVSPVRSSRVFAIVEAKETAFYRSDDFGENWIKLNNSSQNVTWRPFYFAYVIADPKNADRVYKPGLTLSVSDDAGKTFSGGGGGGGGASYHSDCHALWIDPKNPEFLALGTDGGVYLSYDRGTNWRAVQNIPVGQFYHVSYDMRVPYYVYGGLQDNGTWSAPSRASGGIANRLWRSMLGGDGFWAFVDPNDNDILYCEYQGGHLSRVQQSTGETKNIQPDRRADEPKYRWNWNTPVHVGPSKPGALYLGCQFLFRSRDRGDTWEKISPDLTTNDPLKQQQEKSGGLSIDNSSAENHCTIVAISESPKDANVVWVGTDDGNVQVTRDGGKTWTNVVKNVPGLPANTWCSYVSASSHDAATCFATFDGHMLGDMKPYVAMTTDYGKSWTPLATSDLVGYAHVVRQDTANPDLLFVGTEYGLFVSLDRGKQWAQFKGGMPNVAVRDLAIHPREGDLLIATHGRGIYIVDDLSPLRSLTAKVLAADGAFLDSRPSELVIPAREQVFRGDTDYEGETPPESAILCYYLKKRHVIGDLKVEIYDASGKLLQTIPGSKRRGINRVEWPMRLKGPKIPPAANLVPNFFASAGPRAAEGEYRAKLIRNKDTYTTTFRLVADPRSTHTAQDRAIQNKAVLRMYAMMNDLTYLAESVADLKDRAEKRADSLAKGDAAATKLRAFAARLETFRGTLVATKEGRLAGDEKLREKLGSLYGDVNGFDGRPTNSQLASADVMDGDLKKAQADFRALLDKELPPVNAALRGKKLDELKLMTREEWEAKQKDS